MRKYVLKRILQLIPSILIVSFIVFWLMDMAGDPVAAIAGTDATQEQIDNIREAWGLNRPLLVRYFEYMFNLVRGDLGVDFYGNEVWPQFAERFPFTLMLIGCSLVLSSIVAIPAGIYAALHKGKWSDTIVVFGCLAGDALPEFWLGLMLMSVFAVRLGWLPTSGIAAGVLLGLILPGCTSALSNMSSKCRQTRSSMLDCLNADYIRTAQAKGVRRHDVVWKHALKNALLPIITVIGNGVTLGVGGAVTLETVFAWPGIGTVIVPAIRSANFPVACGCIMMTTIIVGILNLLVDLAYAFADPRVKARYTGK